MFNKIKNFIWLLICESDEKYPDLMRVSLLIGVLSAIGLASYYVFFLGKDFDFMGFCTGISALIFGGGAGVGTRAKLEDGTGNSGNPKNTGGDENGR